MTTELVEDALKMDLYERQPDPGLLHHSDRGSQYASDQLRKILDDHHISVSMSRTGNCYDNAMMESLKWHRAFTTAGIGRSRRGDHVSVRESGSGGV